MVWAGLIAALSLVQQVLAGFFDLTPVSWSGLLNSLVWFGAVSLRGNHCTVFFCHQSCMVMGKK
jgi:hypothetical protein